MSKKTNTKPKRKVLGRGLSSLISGAPAPVSSKARESGAYEKRASKKNKSEAPLTATQIKEETRSHKEQKQQSQVEQKPQSQEKQGNISVVGFSYLPIGSLIRCEKQPRKHFSEKELSELSSSIKEQGVLQPILVRPLEASKSQSSVDKYEIIAGERRFRAAKLAKLKQVPVSIKSLSDKEAFAISIVENVQREDLNPVEEAKAYERLVNDYGESQESIAKAVGKERSTVANMIRLLNLQDEVLIYLQAGKLTAGHGRAILKAPEEKRALLAQKALAEKLSVRVLEDIASNLQAGGELEPSPSKVTKSENKKKSIPRNLAVIELENSLRRKLGTKVSLDSKDGEKGELKVSFYSRAELESLLEKFGVS